MSIIAVLVMSIDGRLTKGDSPDVNWSSIEDKEHFKNIKSNAKAIVYGSITYEQGRTGLNPHQRVIVHTRTPQNYLSENPNVTYTDKTPEDVVKKLVEEGFSDIYVLGGGKIYSMYLSSGLIDELWITVEPKLFGAGVKFYDTDEVKEQNFVLKDLTKLNNNTILLKYKSI